MCYCHIVSSDSTTSFRVEEETGTVGWYREVSSHLETWFEGWSGSLCDKVFDGEEEWYTFTSWKLNGGGSVIKTFEFTNFFSVFPALPISSSTAHAFGSMQISTSFSPDFGVMVSSPITSGQRLARPVPFT